MEARFTPIIKALMRGPMPLMPLARATGLGRESMRRRLRVLIDGGKVERFIRDGGCRTEYRVCFELMESPAFEAFTDTLDRQELAVVCLELLHGWDAMPHFVSGLNAEHSEIIAELSSQRTMLETEAARCEHASEVRERALALMVA